MVNITNDVWYEGMTAGAVPSYQVEQLLAKVDIGGSEYRLYQTRKLRSTDHRVVYFLRDPQGEIVKQWPNADIVDVKREIIRMVDPVNETQLDEDHFSSDQVAAIKSCSDEAVRGYYRKYLQAEATGDVEAADRYAGIIVKRCNLLGVFSTETTTESDAPPAKNDYEHWEDRMKAAGATVFRSDADEPHYDPTVISAYKPVNGKHVLMGEYDPVNDREIFETADKVFESVGNANSATVWTEQVLAAGATEIKDIRGGKVAYLGESRIGVYRVKEEPKVTKKFNDILRESFNVSLNADSEGNKTITVTASDGDAEHLASILKLSGLGHHPAAQSCGCTGDIEVTEEYANAPDEKYTDTDTQLNRMSGGLNKPKRMSNPNNPADNPLAMGKLGVKGGKQLNIEEAKIAESLLAEFASFGSKQLDELSPDAYKNYIDTATGDYAHTNAQRLRTPRDQQTPLSDRMKKRNAGLSRAQTGLDRYADDVVRENVEAEGNIGDEVRITGDVQFSGEVGVIADFGQDRRFVIVDLYNHGKRSFHASDVSLNDSDDSDNYDLDESKQSALDRLGWAHSKAAGLGGLNDTRKRHKDCDTDTSKQLKATDVIDGGSPAAYDQP